MRRNCASASGHSHRCRCGPGRGALGVLDQRRAATPGPTRLRNLLTNNTPNRATTTRPQAEGDLLPNGVVKDPTTAIMPQSHSTTRPDGPILAESPRRPVAQCIRPPGRGVPDPSHRTAHKKRPFGGRVTRLPGAALIFGQSDPLRRRPFRAIPRRAGGDRGNRLRGTSTTTRPGGRRIKPPPWTLRSFGHRL